MHPIRLLLCGFLVLVSSCLAQSLGDVARESREKAKPQARKTITDDDLGPRHTADTDADADLEQARKVIHDLCGGATGGDASSLGGRDKQSLISAVQVLSDRRSASQQKLKGYGDQAGELEEKRKREISGAFPKGRPATDDEAHLIKVINDDYKKRFEELMRKAKAEGKVFEELGAELTLAGKQCPPVF